MHDNGTGCGVGIGVGANDETIGEGAGVSTWVGGRLTH